MTDTDVTSRDDIDHGTGEFERVFHEKQIPPGSICRKARTDDSGEAVVTPWFLVLSHPEMHENIGERIKIVWIEGDEEGEEDTYFLGDLGVQPPYYAACEKHPIQIPERYISQNEKSLLSALDALLSTST